MSTEQNPGIGVPWIIALAILAAAFFLGRCTAPPAAAQEPPKETTGVATPDAGYDFTDNAARALADLDAFLDSVTTTTTLSVQHPAAAPAAVPAAPTSSGDRWDTLAQCETGGDWATNTGNGFGGGLQFMHQSSYSTWLSFGGGEYAPHPWEASREQQIDIAERVLASSGWGAWPGCSRKNGWL